MLMLVLMTLTWMQGHSGLDKAKNISTTKQALSIKLATTVSHFYVTLTLLVLMTLTWMQGQWVGQGKKHDLDN